MVIRTLLIFSLGVAEGVQAKCLHVAPTDHEVTIVKVIRPNAPIPGCWLITQEVGGEKKQIGGYSKDRSLCEKQVQGPLRIRHGHDCCDGAGGPACSKALWIGGWFSAGQAGNGELVWSIGGDVVAEQILHLKSDNPFTVLEAIDRLHQVDAPIELATSELKRLLTHEKTDVRSAAAALLLTSSVAPSAADRVEWIPIVFDVQRPWGFSEPMRWVADAFDQCRPVAKQIVPKLTLILENLAKERDPHVGHWHITYLCAALAKLGRDAQTTLPVLRKLLEEGLEGPGEAICQIESTIGRHVTLSPEEQSVFGCRALEGMEWKTLSNRIERLVKETKTRRALRLFEAGRAKKIYPNQGDPGANRALESRLNCLAGKTWQCSYADSSLRPPKISDQQIGFRLACENGSLDGCIGLGIAAKRIGNAKEAEKWLELTCAAEKGESCAWLWASNEEVKDLAPGDETTMSLLERSCKKGKALSCFYRGLAAKGPEEIERIKFYSEACKMGEPRSCDAVIQHNRNVHSRADYRTFIEKACSPENPTACSFLGELEAKEGRPNQSAKAYQTGCSAGRERDCSEYETQTKKTGMGAQAMAYFESGCNGGNALHCGLRAFAENPDFERTSGWHERGCSGGFARSCGRLGFLSVEKREYAHARDWFRKACELKSYFECFHVGEMETKLGKTANAKKFYEIACQQQISFACDKLGKKLEERNPANERLEWIEKLCRNENSNACGLLKKIKG